LGFSKCKYRIYCNFGGDKYRGMRESVTCFFNARRSYFVCHSCVKLNYACMQLNTN